MEKKKTDLKEILSFLLILAGSAILAINMNTFVEQGGLVPGGFSGLSKLIQRVALTFFGLKIPFTLLNVFFNAIPAMLALLGKSLRSFPVSASWWSLSWWTSFP